MPPRPESMMRVVFFWRLLFASFAAMLKEHWLRAGWRARQVHIARRVTVVAHSPKAIEIGPGAAVGLGTLLLSTIEMSALPAGNSYLRIGANTAINEYCNIRASGGNIQIGHDCIIAQMVSIIASNHSTRLGLPMKDQPWSTETVSVSIGNDVWIGAGAVILPGSRLEDGAVIAAGAVVKGLIPAGEIWGGIPARRLKRRGDDPVGTRA